MNKRQVGTRTVGMILGGWSAVEAVGDRAAGAWPTKIGAGRQRAGTQNRRRLAAGQRDHHRLHQTQAVIATFPSMETCRSAAGGYVGFGAVQKSDQVGMGAWRHHIGGRDSQGRVSILPIMLPLPSAPPAAALGWDSAQGFSHDQCFPVLAAPRLPAQRQRMFSIQTVTFSRGPVGTARRRGCE